MRDFNVNHFFNLYPLGHFGLAPEIFFDVLPFTHVIDLTAFGVGMLGATFAGLFDETGDAD